MKTIFALLAMAPFTAFAHPRQAVNTDPSSNVTCIAENTSHINFTGKGATINDAKDQALKFCNGAGSSTGDCSIVSCKTSNQ